MNVFEFIHPFSVLATHPPGHEQFNGLSPFG